ncbi:MAG TPA: S41 family peptidase [Daejeonella sp.]|nr:S41 family peptidase [Daejeonella sp.]
MILNTNGIRKYLFIFYLPIFLFNTSIQAQEKTLTAQEKIYGLSKFWQEANYNFAYFDNVPQLNFDSLYQAYIPQVLATKTNYDYYRLLQKFCASLKDGHTYIILPKDLREKMFTPALEINRINNHVFITNTGQSYSHSIPLGSEIIQVNGMDVLNYLNTEIYPYFSASTPHIRLNLGAQSMLKGLQGTSLTLKIQKPDQTFALVKIRREQKNEAWVKPVSGNLPLVDFKLLEGNIGLLTINTFVNSQVLDAFKQKLPEIHQSKALIIDLRRNNGGNGSVAMEILKHFTNQEGFTTLAASTRKNLSSYRASGSLSDTILTNLLGIGTIEVDEESKAYFAGNVWEKEPLHVIKNDLNTDKYLKPLVLLTGNQTVSAAEDFLITMENLKRGTRIGQATKGSTGQPLFFALPQGGLGAICTRKNTYPDGKKFVGIGVVPNIEVPLTLADYMGVHDSTLSKALDFINGLNAKN